MGSLQAPRLPPKDVHAVVSDAKLAVGVTVSWMVHMCQPGTDPAQLGQSEATSQQRLRMMLVEICAKTSRIDKK